MAIERRVSVVCELEQDFVFVPLAFGVLLWEERRRRNSRVFGDHSLVTQ